MFSYFQIFRTDILLCGVVLLKHWCKMLKVPHSWIHTHIINSATADYVQNKGVKTPSKTTRMNFVKSKVPLDFIKGLQLPFIL